jgi:hypothetical protein
MLSNVLGAEEHGAIRSSVGLSILNTSSIESLLDSAGGLISGQNALTWRANFLGRLDELLRNVLVNIGYWHY